MGILSSLLSTGSKVALAREWAKERARRDLGPAAAEIVPLVDSLPMAQVMGLPEYTVITIVETYADLTKRKIPPGEILARIETHRSSIGHLHVRLPDRAELEVYVFSRVSAEHADAEIGQDWIDLLVARSRERFGLPARVDMRWMDAPMITRQAPTAAPMRAKVVDWRARYEALHTAVRDHYWLGVSTEAEFLAAIEPFMEDSPPA